MQHQRIRVIVAAPDGPHVVGGKGGDAGKLIAVISVRAGHDAPLGAIPVFRQRLIVACRSIADGPNIVRADHCDAGQGVLGTAVRVRARNLCPLRPVPILDQSSLKGMEATDRGVRPPDRPHVVR